MEIKELLEKRARLVKEARAVLDKAEAEKRSLTKEEQTKYDTIFNDALDTGEQAKRMEEQAKIEKTLAEELRAAVKPEPGKPQDPKKVEKRQAFAKFLQEGRGSLNGAEARALQADADVSGGYIVPPQEFVANLIKAVDNVVHIRKLSNVIQLTSAASLGQPALDNDPADSDWTSELGTGNEDSTMSFGKRDLKPHPLAKRIKISNKLVRLGAGGIESLVRDRLAYKFGITEEKAFLTGSGSGQPLGVFTASSSGISTSRDVSTDNTTTAITMENLKAVKYALKQPYWNRASWMFHRDAVKAVALLKDGDDRFMWQDSVVQGEPDRLLGFPVYMSEYVPNTFTTGLYVGILGDFKMYHIAESLDMQLQRLVELYAETNQIGYIGRMELDAMPVLEEAFVRVTLA